MLQCRTNPVIHKEPARESSQFDVLMKQRASDNLDSEPHQQQPCARIDSGQVIQTISMSMESMESSTLQNLSLLPDSFDFLAQMILEVLGDSFLFQRPLIRHQPNKQNMAGISDERLQLIETLWPAPMKAEVTAPSPVCLNDIVSHPANNLFSSPLIGVFRAEENPSELDFSMAIHTGLSESVDTLLPQLRERAKQVSFDLT